MFKPVGSGLETPTAPDLAALRLSADPFVDERHFSAFCRKGPDGSSLTRRVFE